MDGQRSYLCIDLKSFYASVECRERGLDPLTANLVVADESRTEKTICLAVSPSLKKYGIPGRARLFEVVQKVREVNARRLRLAPGQSFTGESFDATELSTCPSLELKYIAAPPRMALYMQYSTRIYEIYLRFVAQEDLFVYSVDEVFMDITDYMHTQGLSARDFAATVIGAVYADTGITATAGVGTNLYLAKIAMDIEAKHAEPDKNGARVAELDEMSYRRKLWEHRPLTDFWRVGRGIAKKLEANGMFTMGDVALRSTYDENTLYKLFGVNAELLIDHAWGWENCTMETVKAYKPGSSSISSGQVLSSPYTFEKAKLIVREMSDMLALEMVKKALIADQLELTVGYDIECLTDPVIRAGYKGPITTDHYGRKVPKQAHGTVNLGKPSSSAKQIINAMTELYDRIVDPALLVRRMYVVANNVTDERSLPGEEPPEQLDLFTDYEQLQSRQELEKAMIQRERRRQEAIIAMQKKYGKNAVVKGMDLEEGATTMDRNRRIGGHKAD